MDRRVVVTGVGLTSPLGETTEASWNNAVAGRSGIVAVPGWNAGAPGCPAARIAGLVPTFDYRRWLPDPKMKKRGDRFIHLAYAAAHQAWLDAGLPPRLEDAEAPRAATIVGIGFGGLTRVIEEHKILLNEGKDQVSAYSVVAAVSNMCPGYLAMRYNLRGPNMAPASACASGSHALGEALLQVQSGRCDLALAGGVEACINELSFAAFSAAGALCVSHNDDPTRASRPFDRSRDGFVMGEGSGMLVLEELEHARARGARIYAEFVGYGASCDAWHPTNPSPGGEGAVRAMLDALRMARLSTDEIGYINAHGTATQPNDRSESEGIKAAFGPWASGGLMVSSTKSMTGHLLGGAGGIEAVFTVLALHDQIVPPTINHVEPDPGCDLDFVPNTARRVPLRAAMSNSFGFGGTNAVLAFARAA
jgi:3-oxoacyl-[acyl-carrier-protein] synthase II